MLMQTPIYATKDHVAAEIPHTHPDPKSVLPAPRDAILRVRFLYLLLPALHRMYRNRCLFIIIMSNKNSQMLMMELASGYLDNPLKSCYCAAF